MDDRLSRQAVMIGESAIKKLGNSSVLIVGLGGVGASCAEAIVRAGIGNITVVDCDVIETTNINRQLFATTSTIGLRKVDVASARLLDINPNLSITSPHMFVNSENLSDLFSRRYDYVIDCIDTVTSKLALSEYCHNLGIPLICCLGTGNRLDPSKFTVGSIEQTSGCGCPLARVMRRELRRRNLSHQTVLYSTEIPVATVVSGTEHGRHPPGSISFVPPAAGLVIASYVVRDLIK